MNLKPPSDIERERLVTYVLYPSPLTRLTQRFWLGDHIDRLGLWANRRKAARRLRARRGQ